MYFIENRNSARMKLDSSSIVIVILMLFSTSLSQNAIAYLPTTIRLSTGRNAFGRRIHAPANLEGCTRDKRSKQQARTSTKFYSSCDDLQRIPFKLEYVDTELQYVCEQQYERLHRYSSSQTPAVHLLPVESQHTISKNNEQIITTNTRRNQNNLIPKSRVFILKRILNSKTVLQSTDINYRISSDAAGHVQGRSDVMKISNTTVSSIQRRVRNPFVIGKRVFQRAFQSIFHDWELNEASIALLSRNFV